MDSRIFKTLTDRVAEQLRIAQGSQPSAERLAPEAVAASSTITLRVAGPSDAAALERLNGFDRASLPVGDVLLALIDGAPVAAVGLDDRRLVAPPPGPNSTLLALLRLRAAQLTRPRVHRWRRWLPTT